MQHHLEVYRQCTEPYESMTVFKYVLKCASGPMSGENRQLVTNEPVEFETVNEGVYGLTQIFTPLSTYHSVVVYAHPVDA